MASIPISDRIILFRRLQALAVLDCYAKAGRWSERDQLDAHGVILGGLGDYAARWASNVVGNGAAPVPGDPGWYVFSRGLASGILDAVRSDDDTAPITPPEPRKPAPRTSSPYCDILTDCILKPAHTGFCKRGCRRCDDATDHLGPTCPKGPYTGRYDRLTHG